MDQQEEEPTRDHYYLAQIAIEIRRMRYMWAKVKKRLSVKDALIRFERKVTDPNVSTSRALNNEEARKQRLMASKMKWMLPFGVVPPPF